MPDGGDTLDLLDTLPKKVRDFVLSPKVAEANRKLAKSFVLSRQEQEELMDSEYKIFFKQINFGQFLDELAKLAERGKHPATAMQKMVVEELLLPINDYFSGAPEKWLARGAISPTAIPAASSATTP